VIAVAQLPSGAVTFLFTDIEGSTVLVKQLRDGYEQVLSEHRSLLRAAFSNHGGHEIATHGDSFFVAFSSARDAVLAAVEGQLALLSHRWPEGVQVKVRMGIHTGQAAASDGNYSGLAVHRAARICAAGHGGQVLVSQATQTLLEDEEEDLDIFLRDLGEHRLKDLDRPVRLYQADTDGLPAAFPPLRPAAELARTAGTVAPPLWRRPLALAAGALALTGLLAAIVVFATRDSAGGASEVEANHVGVIDPETNRVVAEVPVGTKPGPMAVGGGSVWVGNLQDRTLTRIDLGQHSPAGTISLDDRTPTGISFGAGALWIAHGKRGQLSRVDPPFKQVTKTIDVADPGSQRGAVAVGAGSVWAVYGDSTLAQIDPVTTHVAGATFAGAGPSGVVVANGLVSVVNFGDASVTRYGPRTYEGGPIGKAIRVGRQPSGIAYGEGALWVADTGDDTVTRIDPSTSSTTTIRVGDGPTGVAVGGGLVWVANAAGGTVSRIDPVRNEVVQTIKVGNAPAGIVFGGDSVWVTVQAG
jgi:YVTN family beta-propeller protein